MDENFKSNFLKSLKAKLKEHGFSRLTDTKFIYKSADASCVFELQKSSYSDRFYFNLYFKDPPRTPITARFYGRETSVIASCLFL